MRAEFAGWVGPGRDSVVVVSGFGSLITMVLLIVASTLALFYGRSICSLVASAPAVAWLLSRGEDSEKKSDVKKKKPVQDPRLHGLDDAIGRRWARAQFYRTHPNFDHNCLSESDVAKGLTISETYVLNSKGVEVFVKSWLPTDEHLHGVIFLCHGYGDSVTFYAEGVARTLALAGYAVYGMDYPGFGMSEGLHGYIPNFDKLVDDVIEQYRIIKGRAELKGLPCFLFGESMGGAVALRAHLKVPTMWDGAVLVAPMCKIADSMYPPWILVQILVTLARVIPKAKLVPGNNIAEIGFRDPVKRKIADMNPVAYVGNPRLGTAVQMLRITDYIESNLQEVSLPLLVLHGGADLVTDPAISKLLDEKAKSTDKTLRYYDDAWHCLLQGEPDDTIHVIMKDVISWLDTRAATKTSFPRLSEREFDERVAGAVPSLINFGRFNVATQAS
ncbi:hypothetical protein KC19_10G052900 [Ceratodon purpureus]|uniref:Serine aminopeptidase S33 domain-containing protein n=1 Tax=Ceratodon purpureus TaxID=3225 RepID=A0A8T0GM01_CERPU|nr:hypothetical protein KC19_10G052900 [Ceratodon purpureus]